jgi:hypothetical protein
MRETKQSQARVIDREDASARRPPWLDPLIEPIPQGARLVWDEDKGRLVVRLPKARWE